MVRQLPCRHRRWLRGGSGVRSAFHPLSVEIGVLRARLLHMRRFSGETVTVIIFSLIRTSFINYPRREIVATSCGASRAGAGVRRSGCARSSRVLQQTSLTASIFLEVRLKLELGLVFFPSIFSQTRHYLEIFVSRREDSLLFSARFVPGDLSSGKD